ncbi:MAG: acetyl-CoA acetyltransferase [Planctomycetota bacterium]|nr:MAG: acetyl-CoA acetyltransferase [Planctomycetota bacterium]
MPLSKTYIPYGAYWSSPFCRWQGQLSDQHSLKLAAGAARQFLEQREIGADVFDQVLLGMTVPQHSSFYGAPWLAALLGAPGISGPTIHQACATSARLVATAATEIEVGLNDCVLGIAADRTSNGPHLVYPRPDGFGGKPDAEDWVWDNFSRDPWAKNSMIQTAENVAAEAGISREEQDEIALLRYKQYMDGMAKEREFQKRYMLELELKRGRKLQIVSEDEGVFPTTKDGLAKLEPVQEGGTVTFAAQTHPADGNAGIVLCSEDRAAELSRDKNVKVQVLGFGAHRVEKGFMPKSVVPAAQNALKQAGIELKDVAVIKTHNPFAVNDAYFCKQLDIPIEKLNDYGSPLVYGHPQGPTGLRATIEMIEQLLLEGGGYGLFTGCAAGDNALALVLRVDL